MQVLRTIDKYGGLDNYLLKTFDAKLESELVSRLKMQLIEHQKRILRGQPPVPLPKKGSSA